MLLYENSRNRIHANASTTLLINNKAITDMNETDLKAFPKRYAKKVTQPTTFLMRALEILGTCVSLFSRKESTTGGNLNPISPIPANRPGMCPRKNVASLMGQRCGQGSRPERSPGSQSLATAPIARGVAELLGKAGQGRQVAGVE
jgi:hypothetical protein